MDQRASQDHVLGLAALEGSEELPPLLNDGVLHFTVIALVVLDHGFVLASEEACEKGERKKVRPE